MKHHCKSGGPGRTRAGAVSGLVGRVAVVVTVALILAGGIGWPAPVYAKRPAIAGVVNINTAGAAELEMLAGVGPAKAARIIEYRAKHPFRTVEELGRVKGIGPKTVRKLRLYLTVKGPTTAHAASPTVSGPVSVAGAAAPAKPTGPPPPPPAPPAPAMTGSLGTGRAP